VRELRVSRAYLAIEGGTRVKARGRVGQIADSWSPGGRSGRAPTRKLALRARGRGAGGEVRELRVSRAYLAIEWVTRVGARGLVGQIAVLWRFSCRPVPLLLDQSAALRCRGAFVMAGVAAASLSRRMSSEMTGPAGSFGAQVWQICGSLARTVLGRGAGSVHGTSRRGAAATAATPSSGELDSVVDWHGTVGPHGRCRGQVRQIRGTSRAPPPATSGHEGRRPGRAHGRSPERGSFHLIS